MLITEQKKEGGEVIIYTFKRENDKRIIKKIDNFEPYFYINAKDNLIKSNNIVRTEKGFIGLNGEKLIKVFTKRPENVPQERIKYVQTYEADILYPTRWVIDNVKTIPKKEIRVQYLDIETDDSLDTEETPKPITLIGVYDNFLKKHVIFAYKPDMKEDYKEKENAKSVYFFKKEEDMLNHYLKFTQETDPEIITGWNVINFDLKYIINRLKLLKLDYSKLSPIREVSVRKGYFNNTEIIIKGRVSLDMLQAYRKLKENEIESNKLNDVGQIELGIKKIYLSKSHGQIWRDNINKFIEYNIRDIDIVIKINEKYKIIDYFDEISRLSKCKFEDVFYNTKVLDCLMLSFCKDKFVLPTKNRTKRKEKYEGGYVKVPPKGIHSNVICVDFASLYPNIIRELNMSVDTVSSEKGNYKIGNGVFFNSKKSGIIPQILETFFKKRREYKKERNKYEIGSNEYNTFDNMQYSTKVILNSMYGGLGFSGFRLYDKRIASSITYIARDIIKESSKFLEEKGFTVLYNDTDSCYIKSKKIKLKDIVNEGKEIEKLINEQFLNEYIKKFGKERNKYLYIEFEKICKNIIFIDAKKRYASLIWWKNE